MRNQTSLFFRSLAVGLAAASLALSTARAAITTYSDGDILLGFRATGGTGASSELVVNLGTFNQFITQPSTFVVTNLLADLNSTYGASWATRTDLFWGVMGVDDSATDVFLTRGPSPATPWLNRTFSQTQGAVGSIESAGAGYAGLTSGTNPLAAVETNAVSTNNHWSLFAPTVSGFLPLPGIDQAIGSVSSLDLFRLSGDGSAVGQASLLQGTFSIATSGGSAGDISFGYSAAVPEPGRALLLGFGLASVLFRRRRSARVS